MGFLGIDLDGISQQISGSLESSPLLSRAVDALDRGADALDRIADAVEGLEQQGEAQAADRHIGGQHLC